MRTRTPVCEQDALIEQREILAVLEALRPSDPAIWSTVFDHERGGRLSMRLTGNPTQWAVVSVPDPYWFTIRVSGHHEHLIIDEDASSEEIRDYMVYLARIAERYLIDQPRPRLVGRYGVSEVSVRLDGEETVLTASGPGSCFPGLASLVGRLIFGRLDNR